MCAEKMVTIALRLWENKAVLLMPAWELMSPHNYATLALQRAMAATKDHPPGHEVSGYPTFGDEALPLPSP